jgi:protein-L-isoaspartate(D-aspartate) O-methyltransferase
VTRRADSARLRDRLVADLERRELIRSTAVREAFRAVPRELFVAGFAAREGLAAVYRDEAIVTKTGQHGLPLSSSSQPAIMALMLEQLEVGEGMRVLEIGAGTGYNAALLSLLVGERGRVVSLDVDREIAAGARRALGDGGYRVRVVHADGRGGFSNAAPYDRIIVTASAEEVPRAWSEQLADDGLLEVPLRLDRAGMQVIPVLRKTPAGFRSVRAVAGGFMPLRDAGDESGGAPPQEPALVVTDLSGNGPESFAHLCGVGLRTLSQAAKRRLLATALGKPRRRRLGLKANGDALGLYLSLTLPKSRLITMFPSFAIGAIGRDGRSLAVVELFRPERPKVAALQAYGRREGEQVLVEHVREWARRGRPGPADLRISIKYVGDRSRLVLRWPPARP